MLRPSTDTVMVDHLQGRRIDDIDVFGADVGDVDALGDARHGVAELTGRRVRINVNG